MDGRSTPLSAQALGIMGLAGASALFILALTVQYLREDPVVNEVHRELWPRPVQGTINAVQAVAEATILNNLGLDAATTPFQAAALLGIVGGLWHASRRHLGPITPLEAAGLATVVASALLAYLFRGNLAYASLRPVGWYHAIPQVGAVLFGAGWWSALLGAQTGAAVALRVRGLLGVILLVLVLGGMQWARAVRLTIESAPPLAPSETALFVTPALRAERARFFRAENAELLHRALVRLDRVEQIARGAGIGKAAIRRVFGRVLVPGIPQRHTADAASLLRIPAGETGQDAAFIGRALGEWYMAEPEPRPPWLEASDPWPPKSASATPRPADPVDQEVVSKPAPGVHSVAVEWLDRQERASLSAQSTQPRAPRFENDAADSHVIIDDAIAQLGQPHGVAHAGDANPPHRCERVVAAFHDRGHVHFDLVHLSMVEE